MADAYGINWGALEQPNILGGYLQGREYRQKQEQNVLDRQRQTRVDERQDKVWQREDDQIANRKKAFTAYAAGDKAGANKMAMESVDPETLAAFSALDESQRKIVAANNEKVAGVAFGLLEDPATGRQYSDQEIAAMWPQVRSQLDGVLPPDKLDGFQPTRAALMGVINSTMSVKELYEMSNKRADNRRQEAQQAETARHNRTSEGISRGNLGVAQSNASRGWAAHKARQAAGGYGTPGVGGASAGVADDEVELD